MKQIIQTNNAPQAIGPYSQAVMANGTLYVSGQQSNKKAYFANTRFAAHKQWASTSKWYHPDNLMLQAALRVSYTSPKVSRETFGTDKILPPEK